MPLPTLDDIKRHLNVTSTSDDAELSDILAAARNVTEGFVGPLSGKTMTETHRRLASDVVLLRHRPVSSLGSVSFRYYAGYEPETQSLTDFDLDAEAGLLRLASGYSFRGDVTVTYTAGFDTVPQAVWLATLIIAAHLWETQRGTSPSALALQGADPDLSLNTGAGYAIPNRASELLAPYARGAQVA